MHTPEFKPDCNKDCREVCRADDLYLSLPEEVKKSVNFVALASAFPACQKSEKSVEEKYEDLDAFIKKVQGKCSAFPGGLFYERGR